MARKSGLKRKIAQVDESPEDASAVISQLGQDTIAPLDATVEAQISQDLDNETVVADEEAPVEAEAESLLVDARPSHANAVANPNPDVPKFRNKQRTLLISSRGTISRFRHLQEDLQKLLPHSKKEAKFDTKDRIQNLNEIADLKNCNSTIYFESRKKQDLYIWLAKTPEGPSVKFHTENIHTMDELRMTGNCLLGSRPLLSFDGQFESTGEWKLLKEIFIQTFGTPNYHPKSKPFVDHVFSFSICDDRVWFRNYQIVKDHAESEQVKLVEIGPRFTLNPIRIFSGAFGGETLFQNNKYITPNMIRASNKKKVGTYAQRIVSKKATTKRRKEAVTPNLDLNEIYKNPNEN